MTRSIRLASRNLSPVDAIYRILFSMCSGTLLNVVETPDVFTAFRLRNRKNRNRSRDEKLDVTSSGWKIRKERGRKANTSDEQTVPFSIGRSIEALRLAQLALLAVCEWWPRWHWWVAVFITKRTPANLWLPARRKRPRARWYFVQDSLSSGVSAWKNAGRHKSDQFSAAWLFFVRKRRSSCHGWPQLALGFSLTKKRCVFFGGSLRELARRWTYSSGLLFNPYTTSPWKNCNSFFFFSFYLVIKLSTVRSLVLANGRDSTKQRKEIARQVSK